MRTVGKITSSSKVNNEEKQRAKCRKVKKRGGEKVVKWKRV